MIGKIYQFFIYNILKRGYMRYTNLNLSNTHALVIAGASYINDFFQELQQNNSDFANYCCDVLRSIDWNLGRYQDWLDKNYNNCTEEEQMWLDDLTSCVSQIERMLDIIDECKDNLREEHSHLLEIVDQYEQ